MILKQVRIQNTPKKFRAHFSPPQVKASGSWSSLIDITKDLLYTVSRRPDNPQPINTFFYIWKSNGNVAFFYPPEGLDLMVEICEVSDAQG
jgi:hypothetical protein